MNKQKSFILMILLIPFMYLSAQSKDIKFEEYQLDNGLHVILHQNNSTPIVAVTVLYHVGSKNEKPDRTGFAHFFEHLMFEGSEYIPRETYFKLVEENGGALNANTSFDRTFYYEILPSNQIQLGLWLESERMLHLKIDSIGVETQRKVVKEEKKQRIDNQPYGTLIENIFKSAYKVHPYRWTPIGKAQYIDQASIDEFIHFYKTYYVPNNATLSIAGDINIDETKEMIEQYFGDIPSGTIKIERPTEVEPQQTAEIRDTVYDNVQLPLVLQAYHIPAQGTEDFYALSMLTQLLTGGQSSRMRKALVDNQQIALTVQTIPFPLEDPGLFIVFGLPNMGQKPEDLENAMIAELDKTKNELITENEFQKLRNQVENDFYNTSSTDAGIAEALADYSVYYGDANLINTEIDRYMKVTREDIQRVAKKYLTQENRVVLYYLPKAK